MTFECTINDEQKSEGSTVWQGPALSECDEIILLHTASRSNFITTCNDTITGLSLNVTEKFNGSDYLYTSQLDVIVMPEMTGKIIECLYDDGTSESLVASTSLNVNTYINVCMQTMNATGIYMGAGKGKIL